MSGAPLLGGVMGFLAALGDSVGFLATLGGEPDNFLDIAGELSPDFGGLGGVPGALPFVVAGGRADTKWEQFSRQTRLLITLAPIHGHMLIWHIVIHIVSAVEPLYKGHSE